MEEVVDRLVQLEERQLQAVRYEEQLLQKHEQQLQDSKRASASGSRKGKQDSHTCCVVS